MAEQQNQEETLDAGLKDLKTAIVGVGTRVTKKLDALAKNNPNLSDEIQDIADDVAELNKIAAEDAPEVPAETAPADTSTNG